MTMMKRHVVIYKEHGKERYGIFGDKNKAKQFRNKKGGRIELGDEDIEVRCSISEDIGYGDW